VVQWSTVIMVIIYGLVSRQVDFQNAFCQSTLGENEHVYVEIPKGFDAPPGAPPDAVLKLRKTLYGLVQSPKAFYEHLKAGMEALGFAVSELDPCLFIK
jgi:hypothetical protein